MSKLLSTEEMSEEADRCDADGFHEAAAAWRRYASECSSPVTLGDRVVGYATKITLAGSAVYLLLDPVVTILDAFGETFAKWLA